MEQRSGEIEGEKRGKGNSVARCLDCLSLNEEVEVAVVVGKIVEGCG